MLPNFVSRKEYNANVEMKSKTSKLQLITSRTLIFTVSEIARAFCFVWRVYTTFRLVP